MMPRSHRRLLIRRTLVVPAALFVAGAGCLLGDPSRAQDTDETGLVVLSSMEEVGDVGFPISCSVEGLQAAFDHAVALLHHMTYVVAEREFLRIAERDPSCAMAHWGVAMTLVHPVWPDVPTREILQRGASEVALARSLGGRTEREERYIEAIGAFYDEWEDVGEAERIQRWDQAQAAVFEAHPDDDEALAFFALMHIAASPKDDLGYRMNREAGRHLEGLFARRPEHPGAIHYLIHAYDNPPLAEKALEAARSYGAIAPEVPHALHMPSHIFTRLGFWMESVAWNIRAREASRKVRVGGGIVGGMGHASDYLTYAYLQAGRDAEAHEVRDVLFGADALADDFANVFALSAVPARLALELGSWEEAAALEPRSPKGVPWSMYPAYEATSHFARGIGAARLGELDEARESAAALGRLAEQLEQAGQSYWTNQVRVQRDAVEAWAAHSEGRRSEALERMRRAAEAEDALDKHPVTPGAVIPARELYADMLRLEGRWGEALSAYEATLEISPNRFNSLAGAGSSAERNGSTEKAHAYYTRLIQVAGEGRTKRPGLERARAYLGPPQ